VGAFKADLHSLATKIGGLSPKIRKFATEPLRFPHLKILHPKDWLEELYHDHNDR
jgi:hypothetical protein